LAAAAELTLSKADEIGGARSRQKARFSLQPIADDAGTLLAIIWPRLWEDVVGYVVALDPERVLDDLGGMVADSIACSKGWPCVYSSLLTEYAPTKDGQTNWNEDSSVTSSMRVA
jgi:hypothetical protein